MLINKLIILCVLSFFIIFIILIKKLTKLDTIIIMNSIAYSKKNN